MNYSWKYLIKLKYFILSNDKEHCSDNNKCTISLEKICFFTRHKIYLIGEWILQYWKKYFPVLFDLLHVWTPAKICILLEKIHSIMCKIKCINNREMHLYGLKDHNGLKIHVQCLQYDFYNKIVVSSNPF